MILLFDGRPLHVELATTDASRTQGLRGRTSLASDAGMLFVWDRPGVRTMTMRETEIPLDIAFVDESWRITKLARSIPAYTYPLISGWAQYVVEAPAGFFERQY